MPTPDDLDPSSRDSAERREVEQELRASEEQYRAIFNSSTDAMVLRDADFRVVDVNPAYTTMSGYSREEGLGSGRVLTVTPEANARWIAAHRRMLAGEHLRFEFSAQRKDGVPFEAEVRGMPVRYHGRPHVLYVTRDITERKRAEREQRRLEAQLRQAQKMEAIGQLTGGIAHDFNNILASIMGYNVLALERATDAGDHKAVGYLEEAMASCRRARDLVQQMLTFSRGSPGEPHPLQLARLVHDSTPLLRSTMPATIGFEFDCDRDAPPVLADEIQTDQVLLNLCINARDAMGQAGTLRVGVRSVEARGLICASCRAAISGPHVELSVADSGSGIDAGVVDRIFEPFFSTKDVGKGSGMGLSIVHGLVHEQRGHVVVESEPGRGATFRVLWPPFDGDMGPARAEPPATRPTLAQPLKGRVLLIDDEASVRGFMRELLTGWGLSVDTAIDARDGLHRIGSGSVYDLVITDQAMPSKTGLAVALELRARRIDVPIFLCTGYADETMAVAAQHYGIRALLHKPIEPAKLRSAIEQVLKREERAPPAPRFPRTAAASARSWRPALLRRSVTAGIRRARRRRCRWPRVPAAHRLSTATSGMRRPACPPRPWRQRRSRCPRAALQTCPSFMSGLLQSMSSSTASTIRLRPHCGVR